MAGQRSFTRNRWFRILGVSFVMYVLSYMDRTNIAMAIPAMRGELGLTPAAMGLATGMLMLVAKSVAGLLPAF